MDSPMFGYETDVLDNTYEYSIDSPKTIRDARCVIRDVQCTMHDAKAQLLCVDTFARFSFLLLALSSRCSRVARRSR